MAITPTRIYSGLLSNTATDVYTATFLTVVHNIVLHNTAAVDITVDLGLVHSSTHYAGYSVSVPAGETTQLSYSNEGLVIPAGDSLRGSAGTTDVVRIGVYGSTIVGEDTEAVFLLSMEGDDESTSFLDSAVGGSAPHTVSAEGGAQISTAELNPFWTRPGVGEFKNEGYLSITDSTDFDLGLSSAPFTIEAWVNSAMDDPWTVICRGGTDDDWGTTNGKQYLLAYDNTTTKITFYYNNSGVVGTVQGPAVALDNDAWHHIAVVFDGTDTKVAVDGTFGSAVTTSYTKPTSSDRTRVADSVADGSVDSWTTLTDFAGTARQLAVAAPVDGKVYVGTGYDGSRKKDWYSYDPSTDSWTTLTDFAGTARSGATAAAVNGKVYVGMGSDGSRKKDWYSYDPSTNSWTTLTDFPGTARYAPTAAAVDGKVYVGTGYDGSNTKDWYSYDPSTDSWTTLTDFPGTARYLSVAAAVDGKVYVGTGDDGSGTKDWYSYDPSTDSWTTLTDFAGTARYGAVAAAVNGKIYVGTGYDGSTYYKDWYSYTARNYFVGDMYDVRISNVARYTADFNPPSSPHSP